MSITKFMKETACGGVSSSASITDAIFNQLELVAELVRRRGGDMYATKLASMSVMEMCEILVPNGIHIEFSSNSCEDIVTVGGRDSVIATGHVPENLYRTVVLQAVRGELPEKKSERPVRHKTASAKKLPNAYDLMDGEACEFDQIFDSESAIEAR